MPRIKFLENFEYKTVPQQTYVYLKGEVALVTQAIANKAIEAKKAEITDFPAPPSGISKTIGKFKNTRKRVNQKIQDGTSEEGVSVEDVNLTINKD